MDTLTYILLTLTTFSFNNKILNLERWRGEISSMLKWMNTITGHRVLVMYLSHIKIECCWFDSIRFDYSLLNIYKSQHLPKRKYYFITKYNVGFHPIGYGCGWIDWRWWARGGCGWRKGVGEGRVWVREGVMGEGRVWVREGVMGEGRVWVREGCGWGKGVGEGRVWVREGVMGEGRGDGWGRVWVREGCGWGKGWWVREGCG